MAKLRHKLIRWLSFGDMLILNADIANDGTIRSRNAGPMLVADCRVWQWDRSFSVSMGGQHPGSLLHFEPYGRQGITIDGGCFDMRRPGRAALASLPQSSAPDRGEG